MIAKPVSKFCIMLYDRNWDDTSFGNVQVFTKSAIYSFLSDEKAFRNCEVLEVGLCH